MGQTMRLIVVIATAGQRMELLKRTLVSISQAQRPTAYARTVVVENGQCLGAATVVGELAAPLGAEYRHFPQANKSAALNAILNDITDDNTLMLFADDDVRVAAQWLQSYAAAGQRWGRGTFFGGPLEIDYPDGAPLPWVAPFLPASATGWRWQGQEVVRQPVFLGANWAAFAGDLREAGGYDPSRGPGQGVAAGGQETMMQWQLLARGASGRYLPEARLWHYVPRERCSEQWAIDRAFRHGLSAGLDGGRCTLAGAAAQWARRAAGLISARRHFKARWWESYNRGVRKGRVERCGRI